MYEMAVATAAAQRRLVELSRQLAKMFDQLVMPEDLASPQEAAAAAAAAAAASAHRPPTANDKGGKPGAKPAAAAKPSTPPAAAVPQPPPALTAEEEAALAAPMDPAMLQHRMNIKQLRRLAIAQAQSAGQDAGGAISGRPHFSLRLWELPPGLLRCAPSLCLPNVCCGAGPSAAFGSSGLHPLRHGFLGHRSPVCAMPGRRAVG